VNAVDSAIQAGGGAAADRVRSEIAAHDAITFARFMEHALYAPGVGYYETRAAADFTQDYVTSPELHPAFGVLLAGQFEEMWRQMGRPDEFWLVEGGPGTGAFASDVLATAQDAFPAFSRTLRLVLIERSEVLRDVQRATLARWSKAVSWRNLEARVDPLGVGCVFANELLDALPVHRVVMRADGLLETHVRVEGNGFADVEDQPSTPALADQIRAGGGRLRDGDRGEVNLAGPAWVRSAAAFLERGYLLFLDYGEPADLLYGARHPRGTLRCYAQHVMNEWPYDRVGLQDITADVDLSAVARAGVAAGFELIGATRQAQLLERLGLADLRRRIDREVAARIDRRAHVAALDLLSDVRQLGRVSALLLGKGVPSAPLAGFSDEGQLALPESDRAFALRLDDTVRLVEALDSAGATPQTPLRDGATDSAGATPQTPATRVAPRRGGATDGY
jgi:SAM-dependent MidA family methyltransferase